MSDTLFDIEPTTQPETPRCRMCARPARWLNARQQWAPYCSGQHCSNGERTCQACGHTFTMGTNGAGTKYCSSACKDDGYNPNRVTRPACAWCGKRSMAAHRGGVWPYICQDCTDPIKHIVDRLKDHHVPHERARSCGRCVRGLICHNCNIAAGMLADDPERARELAAYLTRTTRFFP